MRTTHVLARVAPFTRFRATATRFFAVLALAVLAPSPAAEAAAVAKRVTLPSELPTGPNAQGQVGDYLLENTLVKVVIDDIPNPHGFASTGGNILDAAEVGGQDRFASLFTMFDNSFGRQGEYTSITIVSAGGGATPAQIRATGVDSENPNLEVVTDYTLGPNDRYVRLDTTLTNRGAAAITALQVGDAIQWGLTTHFAPGWANTNRNIPGDGHDIGGQTLTVTWVGSDGLGSSYGYSAVTGTAELSNGSTWSDGNIAYLTIPAAGSAGYSRFFVVGDGSLASISNTLFALRAVSTGTVSGVLTEIGSGLPIANATVAITKTQCLGTVGATSYTLARTGAAGNYSANLEPGTYRILFSAPGRTSSACATLSVTTGGSVTQNGTLSAQELLTWTVRDTSGNLLPAKLSLLYDPPTARLEGPELGDIHTLIGGYSVLSSSGTGSIPVPPGSYTVWVSRGMEYDVYKKNVTLSPGNPATVDAVLTREVDTTGYISADLHVHSFKSADSGIPFEVRAEEAAAEGLEIVVPTEHDYQADMSAAIAAVGVGAWVNTFPGNEVTTNSWGHFNGYPMTVSAVLPRGGALDHAGLSPAGIFAGLRADPKDPVVQVNHPRAGGLGYFDLGSLNPLTALSADPAFSTDFDGVEVFNGKRLYQVPTVLFDWYHLLNTGQRVTALGNTDTHVVYSQELGWPRNFVRVGGDDPSGVAETTFRDAVRASQSMFTNGPFVEIWVDGQAMGGDVTDTDGSVAVRVKVQAPTWIAADTLDIVVNGEVCRTIALANTGSALRYDQTIDLTVARDAWIAAKVTGGDCTVNSSNVCMTAGCPGRLDPVVPPLYGTDPVCPFAHTNPVFVDADGNGRFDPPGNRAGKVEPIAATRPVDASGINTRVNEVVTVRGTVTVPSYTFNHRSNTIYFQDQSLDLTQRLSGGLTIYQSSLIHPELRLGDVIQVTGTMTQFSGLSELVSVAIDVLARDRPVPDPLVVTVRDLRDTARYEQWEGMLVRINGVSITGGTWPGFDSDANITIVDGSGSQTITMRVDADTDVDGSPAPSQPFDLVAEVGQYKFASPYLGFYQLLPRQRIDIIEAADPARILHGPSVLSLSSCEATLVWYTTKAESSTVEYGATPAYGMSASNPAPVLSHSVRLAGLTPGTTYHFRASSTGGPSLDSTFTTPPSPTPTLVGTPNVSSISPDTVEIAWVTDIASDSRIDYGTTASYGSTAGSAALVTEHLVRVTGLVANTGYHFRILSASTLCGGGALTGADETFVTLPSATGAAEVSGLASGRPLLATKNPDGSVTVSFEEQVGAGGYNLYAGDHGAYWSHGASVRNLCDVVTAGAGSGRLAATIAAPVAPGYFLVTAFTSKGEGPAGLGIPDTESTCAP